MDRPWLPKVFYTPLKYQPGSGILFSLAGVLTVALLLVRYGPLANTVVASIVIGPYGLFAALWAAALIVPAAIWLSRSEAVVAVYRYRWLYVLATVCWSTTLAFMLVSNHLTVFPLLALIGIQLYCMRNRSK